MATQDVNRGQVVQEAALSTNAAITASDTVTVPSGRRFAVNCGTAGNVKVGFDDGSTLTFPVILGFTLFPFRVNQVFVAGTTAVATYSNLT